MIKTIRKYIRKLLRMIKKSQAAKIQKLSMQLLHEQTQSKFYKSEMKRLFDVLSEGTWNEGDNPIEAIECAQAEKYLKQYKEDIIVMFRENMEDPEEAARQLLEYFGIKVDEKMERGKMTFIYK